MTLLLEHMQYLYQEESLGKHLFVLLLKTQITKEKAFHLVSMYFVVIQLEKKALVLAIRENQISNTCTKKGRLSEEKALALSTNPQCFSHRKWFLTKIRFLDHDSVVKDTENLLKMFKAYFLGLHLFSIMSEKVDRCQPNFSHEGQCTSKLKKSHPYFKNEI